MYLLDTSAIIEVLVNSETGKKIRDLVRGKEYYISVVTIYELNKAKKKNEKIVYLIRNSNILDFTSNSADISASIYKKLSENGQLVNEMDILIAGIAINKSVAIISLDADFEKIAGNYNDLQVTIF